MSYKPGTDEWVNIKDTDWYKEMKENYSPASNPAFYRKEKKLTEEALGSIFVVPSSMSPTWSTRDARYRRPWQRR